MKGVQSPPPGPGAVELRRWLRLAMRGSPEHVLLLFREAETLKQSALGRWLLELRHHLVSGAVKEAFLGAICQQTLILQGVKQPKRGEPPFDLRAAAYRRGELLSALQSLVEHGDLRAATTPTEAKVDETIANAAQLPCVPEVSGSALHYSPNQPFISQALLKLRMRCLRGEPLGQ